MHSFGSAGGSITSASNNLSLGDAVTYHANGTPIGGLADNQTYFAIPTNANTFQLAAALGGGAINLTTVGNGAQTFTAPATAISLASLTSAIAINSTNRADLGARMNVLSFAIDNLETLSNNLGEAYSRIVDTDYAAETAKLTRNKILQEAAAAMLAQANQAPNVVLSLLEPSSSKETSSSEETSISRDLLTTALD